MTDCKQDGGKPSIPSDQFQVRTLFNDHHYKLRVQGLDECLRHSAANQCPFGPPGAPMSDCANERRELQIQRKCSTKEKIASSH